MKRVCPKTHVWHQVKSTVVKIAPCTGSMQNCGWARRRMAPVDPSNSNLQIWQSKNVCWEGRGVWLNHSGGFKLQALTNQRKSKTAQLSMECLYVPSWTDCLHSLVQWNWFSVVHWTGCTWVTCISDVREPISLHQAVYAYPSWQTMECLPGKLTNSLLFTRWKVKLSIRKIDCQTNKNGFLMELRNIFEVVRLS